MAAFVATALVGVLLQYLVFRRMEGQDLRQTLVTIGISIVLADLMLWVWGGDFYQILTPAWLSGPVETFFVTALKRSTGEPVYLTYPFVRLLILLASVVLGIAMWLVLTRTRIGMLIRAGVDDREMLLSDRRAHPARIPWRVRVRRRAGRHGRRGRRHLPVARARRGYSVSCWHRWSS